jgi:cobalt-zinc-cadmium efflux system protein
MGNGHHHHPRTVSLKLILASVATALFVVFELAIGIYANALSLVGDAFHNLTDVMALLIALFAVTIERRPATQEKSFGYQKAGVLAAFVNAATLVAFTLFIFWEAWERFRDPQPVSSFWMIAASAIGIALNMAITFALRKEGRTDLSIRSAVIHMFGDTLSSAGIIVAAIAIELTGRMIFDPLISVLIGLLILWSSWGILKESMNLLLEGTPTGIDPAAVEEDLAAQAGVEGVHHVHIWALSPARPALSCHLQISDMPLQEATGILRSATAMLEEKYGITHTTIQFEYAGCPADDPFCRITHRRRAGD